MCLVPNMAVFCSSLTSWFPGMLLTYFLNDFEIVPVAPIITVITFIIIIIIIPLTLQCFVGFDFLNQVIQSRVVTMVYHFIFIRICRLISWF